MNSHERVIAEQSLSPAPDSGVDVPLSSSVHRKWMVATRQMVRQIPRVAGAIATDPTVLLTAGHTTLAIATHNPVGVAVQGATTLTCAFLAAKACLENKQVPMVKSSFLLLAAINLTSAAAGFESTIADHGLVFNEATRSALLGNAAVAGWGFGHLGTARQIATGKEPGNFLKKNVFYYGAADVTSVLANPAANFHPVSFGLAAAGFAKSFVDGNKIKPGSLWWHATPARLCGLSYFANGVIAGASNPLFAAATTLWGLGAWCLNPEQNKALRDKIKQVLSRKSGVTAPSDKRQPTVRHRMFNTPKGCQGGTLCLRPATVDVQVPRRDI